MSAMRRSPRWTAMAPPSYTVRPLQREKAQDSALLGLEPVGERLEAALLDAYPEPLLLGLVARTDRERRQNAALEATDPLERRDERADGHHECLGPADLLPLSERLDGRSRDEDQEGDLGLRALELGDLSPHVSVARLHRFGGDHLEAVARQVLRKGRAERLTIL